VRERGQHRDLGDVAQSGDGPADRLPRRTRHRSFRRARPERFDDLRRRDRAARPRGARDVDFVARERVAPERADREDGAFAVSPFSRRCAFTVAAAIDFARFFDRPDFSSLATMCRYWRSRLRVHADGIVRAPGNA